MNIFEKINVKNNTSDISVDQFYLYIGFITSILLMNIVNKAVTIEKRIIESISFGILLKSMT